MRHATIRRTVIPLLLLLTAMLAAPLLAQDPDRRLELLDLPGKWWKHPKVAEGLKLTADQSDRIDLIFLEHRKKLIDLKARMEKQLIDFRELADRPDFRREEAMQLMDQVTATRSEIARSTLLMQLDIRDQLSPEQRAELKKMRDMFRDEIRRKTLRKRMEEGEDFRPRDRRP